MTCRLGLVTLALLGSALFGCSEPIAERSGELGPGDVLRARDELGQTLEFRIDKSERDASDEEGDYLLYTLSARASEGEPWSPYCAPDAEGLRRAIPVRGAWDERGSAIDVPEAVTIACTNGAIAKCIRLGYKPWKDTPERPMRALHQACIRMIRADYCGDGRTHTKDGTNIDVFDSYGVQRRAATDPAIEVFEAAWSADGAVYLNVPRWSDDVASVVAECPEKLAGHTSKDVALTSDEVIARYGRALVMNGRFVREEDRVGPRR